VFLGVFFFFFFFFFFFWLIEDSLLPLFWFFFVGLGRMRVARPPLFVQYKLGISMDGSDGWGIHTKLSPLAGRRSNNKYIPNNK
jgi:hypothetical protein